MSRLWALFGDTFVTTLQALGRVPRHELESFSSQGVGLRKEPALVLDELQGVHHYRLPIHESRRARSLPPEFPYDCKRVVLFAYLADVLAQDLELVLVVFDFVVLLTFIVLSHDA